MPVISYGRRRAKYRKARGEGAKSQLVTLGYGMGLLHRRRKARGGFVPVPLISSLVRHGNGMRKRGGFLNIIPAVLSGVSAAHELGKFVQPATKLLNKFPRLGNVPVLGSLLRGATSIGYGRRAARRRYRR